MRRGSSKSVAWFSILALFVVVGVITTELEIGVNRPPVIERAGPGSPVLMYLGGSVALTLYASDPDIGDVLAFHASARDEGGNLVGGLGMPEVSGNNPASCNVGFVPVAAGNYTVTVSASDGRGGAACYWFTVRAVENHVPTIISREPPSATTLFIGGDVTLRVNASDAEAWQSITFSWAAMDDANSTVGGLGAPVTSGGNPASSQVTFTPAVTGNFTVTATASDGAGGTASHAFHVVATCWDYLEANNGVSNATPVAANTTEEFHDLTVCSVDVDVFILDLVDGSTIDVDLLRSMPSISITISLCYMELDLYGAVATSSGGVADTSFSLHVSGLSAGTFYVHVGAAGIHVDVYDIIITSTMP
ncbi:MAG: hypothetical protein JW839_03655 [Candidatus Lokiarchaeota archaeon]|nr:hypothetical protein [Candidatus Lokiarchaeota archaeon]